ncbi:MAG: aminoacyl-tRNA hydrolase [Proteobacteria bacterium]|nr:aminoacyl-tRNA hydrolase [Pseudomonadota bacterium]
MHLIVGLGNIGQEYEKTRHNLGFLLLDQIIDDYDFQDHGKRFKSEIFSGEISGKKIIALKPHTFMNLSGRAVIEVVNFYKILPKNVLVLHDEIDLDLGRVKIKTGGGNAGHNGLKSIDEAIGKNYVRLRLGVGRPENPNIQTSSHVLGKFTTAEMLQVDKVNQKVSGLIAEILSGNYDKFLNKFSLTTPC